MNNTPNPEWAPRFTFSKSFWVGCASIFLSALFAMATLWTANDTRRLAAQYSETTARVIDTRFIAPTSARDGDGSHFITYTFQWDRQSIVNERDVPKEFYDDHPVDTRWTIYVHPNSPRIHDLYLGQTRETAWGHLLVTCLMGIFGSWLVLSDGNLTALRSRFKERATKIR